MPKRIQHIRTRHFSWQIFGWIAFFALGWWFKGFFEIYFGEDLTLTEVLVKIVKQSGGYGVVISLIGSSVVIIKNIKEIFTKRDSDQ